MDTLAFFEKVWPDAGFYCLAVTTPRGISHKWFDTKEQAALASMYHDNLKQTVYFACSSFTTRENRKNINAAYVGSAWLDLDVGEGPNKFPTRIDAATALKDFCNRHSLPSPFLVNSGGGFHAYFCFGETVAVDRARSTARLLKAVAAHDGFRVDPTRVADFASVLRPVGTHNRKRGELLVSSLNDPEPISFNEFSQLILIAAKELPTPVKPPAAEKQKVLNINAEFLIPSNYPPVDANKVADRCAQIGEMRAKRGDIQEPHWYSALQVLHFCENGDELIHQWSQGHPQYTAQQTDAKIKQIEGFGPTTCAVFEQRNHVGCFGCPHRGKIASPIQLGVTFSDAPLPPARLTDFVAASNDDTELVEEQFVAPPKPFKRTQQGIAYTNPDGIEVLVYPYDLYLHEIAFDEAKQFEVTVCRHWLPQEGWLEFTFRSSDVGSEKEFEKTMRDNHVKPGNAKMLRLYIALYMSEIQQRKRMRKMHSSMGWKDGTESFVLGERAFHSDGTVESVGISTTVSKVASGFHSRGNRTLWTNATALLDRPGMEAHALLFAAGAGAPLMKFTGFEGALFNVVGPSNTGKTSMARFFTSMYGDFELLKLKQKDTDNAKIGRIGMFASLPVYVDEVTNEDHQKVSDFVYEITQGRSKLRSRIDGTERETYPWNTIVVSSSNASLSDKLGLHKANPEAERLRLFEFKIRKQDMFDDKAGEELYHVLSQNYGHAGEIYLRYIVTHQDEVRRGLRACIEQLKIQSHARGEERMWLASIGCALYGLMLMRDLGLVLVDVKRVAKWTIKEVHNARLIMDEGRFDPIELFGAYLNRFTEQMLVVKEYQSSRNKKTEYLVERAPRMGIYMRYDTTQATLWIDMRHLRKFITEQQANWDEFTRFLFNERILLQRGKKTLGIGTPFITSQVEAMEINMAAPELGNTIMQLVAQKDSPLHSVAV